LDAECDPAFAPCDCQAALEAFPGSAVDFNEHGKILCSGENPLILYIKDALSDFDPE